MDRELRACESRKALDGYFSKNNIEANDYKTRIDILLKEMGEPRMFFSVSDPTDQQRYEMAVVSFLSGNWKYAEVVSKINLDDILGDENA